MALPATNLGSNAALLARYRTLEQPGDTVQATYVWIDGKQGLRAKTRTLRFVPKSASELPIWNFDGSSTYQSDGCNSDVYLKPVKIYNDPFRKGNNKLVFCETVKWDGQPHDSNTRHSCNLVMERAAEQEPWFGIEQEYHLMDGIDRNRPVGWPTGGFPGRPNAYYCGVGASRVSARSVATTHYRACLYAGVKMFGINSEAMPGQWEFQVGPCAGISIGDDLWMARFILHRIAEDFHLMAILDPKPIEGWQGNGAHTNFSTKAMRESGGLAEIEAACKLLEKNHTRHIAVYDPSGGLENARRLVAGPVTMSIEQFRAGTADRATSVRIPQPVAAAGCGYFEDRRPAGNCDPYRVCEALVRTVCLRE